MSGDRDTVDRCLAAHTTPSLGKIFRDLGEGFLNQTLTDPEQRKVFQRIAECRTPAMGGAVWRCSSCGHRIGIYHSCRDRHCPNCQTLKRYRWVSNRLKELLPIPYFHVVFTLPHRLNPLIKANPRLCIDLLFRTASKTLLAFGSDPKYLGAVPGILMVLHTWGRRLNYHVHVHCIVTGGGLSKDHTQWVHPPNPDWLFPVRALSSVFKARYLDGLEQFRKRKLLHFPVTVSSLIDERDWNRFIRQMGKKPFVVYAKRPFGGPTRVVKYLGNYTHRVAISNRRIKSYQSGEVTLTYKDYKNQDRTRRQVLSPQDLAKAFLQHVLPTGLMRIRSSGILANTKKRACLEVCRHLLGRAEIIQDDLAYHPNEENQEQETEPDARVCPACKQKRLIFEVSVSPEPRDRSRALLWDSS